MSHYTFSLEPIPPFQLELTVWILRRRSDNLVDRWDGHTYRRILMLDDELLEVAVTQVGSPTSPRLNISLTGIHVASEVEHRVTADLERLLGIYLGLGPFYRFAEGNEVLKPLIDQFCGAKPPRFLTGFETLVNAISCQQLSLTVGIRLLNRLTETYGPALQLIHGTAHAFPRPQDLAEVGVEELRDLGYSRQKAGYIIGLAQLISRNQLKLNGIETLDDKAAVSRLCELKGVGRWSAEYFLLRGLGRTHIFPGDDVGARKNLERWLRLPGSLDYERARHALSAWNPYAGLIYFNLLLKSLAEGGTILR